MWHPFTQMQEWERDIPLIIDRGRGATLIDVEGRRYLDGTSSIWVNLHGHRRPELDRAMTAQLQKIAHSSFLGLSNPPAIELARELVRVAPRGLTRVFYSDDGSTAVEVALKMAIQYWQQVAPARPNKNKFVHLASSYHGDTIGAMSVGGVSVFHSRFQPVLFPSYEAPAPHCYRCPLDLQFPQCQVACTEPIARLLREHSHELAALIIEPMVQAAGGMILAPPGFLRQVRELCTKYEVLLIVDEVATGFGRTGRLFACQHEGVVPDLMAISKGLTGGYLPLAATLTTEKIYRAFLGDYAEWRTFFHGHSYTGNPLACAVALANLKIFRKDQTLTRLRSRIAQLRTLLCPLHTLPQVGDIRQCGFIVGIELVQDKATKVPYPLEWRIGHQVAMESQRQGLLLRPLGNVMVLVPPLTTSLRELTRMVTILRKAIETVTTSPRALSLRKNTP